MKNDLDANGYVLSKNDDDGSYTALIENSFAGKMIVDIPTVIDIPEECDGIPITRIVLCVHRTHKPCTIRVSKNVQIISNTNRMQTNADHYFIDISPENPWIIFDGDAVFSKDKVFLYAFTAWEKTSYEIPNSVKVIFDSAFISAVMLDKITIPYGVEIIGDFAFAQSGISDFDLPDSIKKIGHFAFFKTTANFVLPKHVEDLFNNSFNGARCQSPVFLPDCYNKPEYDMPNYEFAPEYIIDKNSKAFEVRDGIIYTKDMKALLSFTRKAPCNVVIPEGVDEIGAGAALSNNTIKSVTLPESVYRIRAYAFANTELEKINLENVKIIDTSAFEFCSFLCQTGVINAEKIGAAAFHFCWSLKSIRLSNTKEIGSGAFSQIGGNTEIFLPECLEKIGYNAFFDSKFKYLKIPLAASASEGIFSSAKIVEFYDVPDSVIYGKIPRSTGFGRNTLVKVLSPESGEVKFAIKFFSAEQRKSPNDIEKPINGMFGGEKFFDFESYDNYFNTVSDKKTLLSKYEAAHYRIKYPERLTDKAREIYIAYLSAHAGEIIRHILNKPGVQAEEIASFPYLDKVSENDLPEIIDLSAKLGLTEITAFLMDFNHKHFPDSIGNNFLNL